MKLYLSIAIFACFNANGQLITTYAGTGAGGPFVEGSQSLNANISIPGYGCFDGYGNYYFGMNAFVPRICKISPTGIVTTVAGTGVSGYSGDNGPAIQAKIGYPVVNVDNAGNVFIADYYNNRLRKVDVSTGVIHTIAGNGIATSTGDGGLAINSTIVPIDVVIDGSGNVFVSDNAAQSVRKINIAGIITTIANVNGQGMCLDNSGKLYLGGGTRIYRVDTSTGVIDTIAGTGIATYNGDEIPAVSANFRAYYIARDKEGNIYIADDANDRIRKVDLNGIIHTVAGNGTQGYSGDGGAAVLASLYEPSGVAVDTCGNLYIADGQNNRIRKVTYNPNYCNAEGINSLNSVNTISIYPNPAKAQLTVTGGSSIKDILVLNTIGQVLIEQRNYSDKAVVDVSALGTGIYFIKFVDNSGAEVVKRFLKE